MRGHELFLASARRRAEFVHQANLLAHRSPEPLAGVGLNPLAVDLRRARPSFVQTPPHLAVDPVTGQNRRYQFAEATAARDGLEMADVSLGRRPLRHRVQLS